MNIKKYGYMFWLIRQEPPQPPQPPQPLKIISYTILIIASLLSIQYCLIRINIARVSGYNVYPIEIYLYSLVAFISFVLGMLGGMGVNKLVKE